MEKNNSYQKALMRYREKDESGQTIVWPVRTFYVDVHTGELITYQDVYIKGKYITRRIKTKIYEAITNRYIERTIECTATHSD